MNFKIVVLLFLIVLLASCNQANDSIIVTPTPTIPPTRTATLVPTLTSTSVPTSFPPLAGKPPYLVLRPIYDSPQLYIYDNDGSGRKIIDLPRNGQMRGFGKLNKIISPDGNWLVYYEGAVSDGGNPDDLPVSLHILNLKDDSTKKIADIATEGYLAKLNEVAEQLKTTEPDFYKLINNQDWVAADVASAFRWGLYEVAWSPDSRHLAFAAQIDGISSDIYVYDIETGSVQRVEDTLQNVQWIEWSPNGSYLVFANSRPGYVYTGSFVYSISTSNYMTRKPRFLTGGTWLYIGKWLASNILLAADGTDTAGRANLYTIDITTGQTKVLWDDSLFGYAIDSKSQIIAFSPSEFAEPETFGVYLTTFSGVKQKIIDDNSPFIDIAFRGGEKHRFLIAKYTDTHPDAHWEIFGINPDNTTTLIGVYEYQQISPDYTWLLLSDEKKMDLYDKNDELARTFLIPDIDEVLWRPDSQGIFYSTGNELYYLVLPDGMPILVDKCESEDCSFDLRYSDSAWLP